MIDTLNTLTLQNNQFTVSHLLGIAQNYTGTSITYALQDSIDIRERISTVIGKPITMTANIDRTTNPASKYQWFKYINGVSTALTQPSTTGYSYTIASVTQTDRNARYYYTITNTLTNTSTPTFTLFSRMRTLVPFTGWTISTCLEYDTANVTLKKFSYAVNLDSLVARCLAKAAQEDSFLLEYATQKLIETQVSRLYNTYQTQCLEQVSEQLRYTYKNKEYHYTLYYYNQAGNLVQTVPPQGVHPLNSAQVTAFLNGNRTDPAHELLTKYQYNSLNALIEQKTPDAGKSQFWYNRKGQLRLSQNAQQQKDTLYAYTRYDEQGRFIEVGDLATHQALAALTDSLESLTFPKAGQIGYQLTDRTLTHYDFAKPSVQSTFAQQYLRSRVAWVEVLEKGRTDTTATYYSYDVHGNVKSLLQQLPGLGNKRTDYRYDLISGKVNYVFYQYGQAGEFTHRYEYDSDNRLTDVFTSSDGFLWNKEANYQYYRHGPLARVELGEYRNQAQDYYYTLQGWLKGVNMPGVDTPYAGDPGQDGSNGVGKDVYAYSLGYFQGDYQPLNASLAISDSRDNLWPRLQERMQHQGLYNGNISWMVTDLAKVGELNNDRKKGMQGMLYQYDQLNRLVQSRSLTSYNASTGFAARTSSPAAYDEDYSYDANGNLLTLQRRGEQAALQDDFHYQYYANSNKLREVQPINRDKVVNSGKVITDQVIYRNLTLQGSSYVASGSKVEVKATEKIQLSPNFRANQGGNMWAHLVEDDGQYQYDAIGNLVLDQQEGVQIEWTPYGKIRQVKVRGDSLLIRFRYDASGNRVEKQVVLEDSTYATRYVRDASGNVMAIYQDSSLIEEPLYGSSRLGEYKGGVAVGARMLGKKNYELSNHLGNVLAVISDKVGMDGDSVWAKVTSTNDYYPFGLVMKGRTWSDTTGYRFAFNGKERDTEGMGGGGSTYDYGFRIYNPSLGKFLSVDPLSPRYPWLTPYQFASNNPIWFIDVDGLEGTPYLYPGQRQGFQLYDANQDGKVDADEKRIGTQFSLYLGAGFVTVITAGTAGPAIELATYRLVAYFAANPQTAMGLAGTVGAIFDPNPSADYPGIGDEFIKGAKILFKAEGKAVTFIAEEGASFANASEKSWVKKLLGEGKNVTLLAEASEQSVRTADFLVDGIKTELKTVSNVAKTDADNLSNVISQTIKRSSGQADNIIVDLTQQAGASLDVAKRAVARYYGQGSKESIRIVGEGFDQTFKKSDFKKP